MAKFGISKKKRDWLLGSNGFVYLDIPVDPTPGTTTTIEPSDTNIEMADLGGNTDIILAAGIHGPRVRLDTIVGTEGTPIRFFGEKDGDTLLTQIGDGSVTNNAALYNVDSDWVEFYSVFVFGGTCLVWEGRGRNFKAQNCVIKGDNINGFSGYRTKTDNDITVAAYIVELVNCDISEVIGEPFYFGQVNGPLFNNLSFLNILNCSGYDSGREPLQTSHCIDMDINHFSGFDCGLTDESGQNRALQIQDSNGVIRNSVFQSFGTTGSVYALFYKSDGVTLFNCFIEGEDSLFLGDGSAQDWWDNSIIKGNKPTILESCILYIKSNDVTTELCQVFNDQGDFVVRNCIISDNKVGVFADGRTDKDTYNLIDGGGNVFLPNTHPAFNITKNSLKMVTSVFHRNRGIAKRLPDPNLPTYTTNIITGTPTSGQTLTATPSGGDAGDGSSIVNTLHQWWRADNGAGLNRRRIASAVNDTYVLQAADVGKFINEGASGVNEFMLNGPEKDSAYTDVIAAGPFNPFTDIAWFTALDLDAADIATDEFVLNQGSGGNAVKTTAIAIPTYDGTYNGLDFDRATAQNLSIPQETKNTDWELWLNFKLTTLAGNQRLVGYGGSHYVRVTAAGRIFFGATDTGIDILAATDYLIRFKVQGATSLITINNGTPSAQTLTTNSVSGTGRLGCDSSDGNFADMKAKAMFDKVTELSAGNVTDMWTYYGY